MLDRLEASRVRLTCAPVYFVLGASDACDHTAGWITVRNWGLRFERHMGDLNRNGKTALDVGGGLGGRAPTIRTQLHSPTHVPTIWEQFEGIGRWDNVTTLRDRPGEPLNMLARRKVRALRRNSPFRLLAFRTDCFCGKGKRLSRMMSPLAKLPLLNEFFHSYHAALGMKPL